MEKVWRILMLEDTPTDAELAEHELRKASIHFVSKRVDTRSAFLLALQDFRPDIILSDYKLPDFDGMSALEIVKRDHPEVPVIMVTGAFSDIDAVELLAAGAKDYILKDRLARLAPAVQRVLAAEQVVRARKVAEQALFKSELKYRSLVENSSDWIWEIDEDFIFTYCSPRVFDLLGYIPEEILYKKTPFDLMQPDEATRLKAIYDKAMTEGKPLRLLENANLHKDGQTIYLETSGMPFFDSQGICKGYSGINRDISGRKQAQVRIQKLSRIYATLSHTNTTIVRAKSRDELFREVCQGAVKFGKFAMAWIGQVDEATHRIVPVSYDGNEGGFLTEIDMSIDDVPNGRGPTGKAVRENRVVIAEDFVVDERMLPWREAALRLGYHGSAGLPLRFKGKVVWTLTLYSDEPNYFDGEQLDLLNEMSADISFALDNFEREALRQHAETERATALTQLKNTLDGCIQMAATVTETRDPYTAGHQRRVAKLATAIAGEMGLSEVQVDGVHYGSLIHDVGKIAIPAEILSKPGRLTEIEFMLIKTHALAGYNILKGIDFPWPVAQMILQHHERLDGSGYPSGLKADEIIPEARILIVADVVEAMSSHRPYRPGLGIAAALGEIDRGRGTYFDPQVVDACIKLFNDKKFDFSDDVAPQKTMANSE
jgi:PAS domain S-box-containing protein/putative nucleotidyltransferase with HDIG domain